MNWLHNPTYTCLVATALVAAGCSEYPCLDESTTHEIPSIPFTYGDRVRYSYWFEDGAQRVTFERDQIPETTRGAVLVHVEGKDPGGLVGATGWAADVTDDTGSRAYLVPMAMPRAASYAAWAGEWAATWLATRATTTMQQIDAEQTMRDALDPEKLAEDVKEEPEEPRNEPAHGVTDIREQLRDQGISLDGLKLGRALRVVGARQPLPRDFGLSVDVHPIWVFVTPDCGACDAATKWLDHAGIGYHAMLVSDPTNAKTLHTLSQRAGIKEPALPTLWNHDKLLRGFDAAAWSKELK